MCTFKETIRISAPKQQIISLLKRLANEHDPLVCLIVRHTPTKQKRVEKMIRLLSRIMNCYIRKGEVSPFNNPFNIIQMEKGHENDEATYRSMQRFPLHNDRLFVKKARVDFLVLSGLTPGTSHPNTYVVPIAEILRDMPRNLYEALFYKKAFRDPKSGVTQAGLHGNMHDIRTVTSTLDLAPGWMEPLTDEAALALSWLQEHEQDFLTDKYAVKIEPGVTIIIAHGKTMHGRDALTKVDYSRKILRAHMCRKQKMPRFITRHFSIQTLADSSPHNR